MESQASVITRHSSGPPAQQHPEAHPILTGQACPHSSPWQLQQIALPAMSSPPPTLFLSLLPQSRLPPPGHGQRPLEVQTLLAELPQEADAQKESESSRQSYLITTSQHSLQSNPSFRCLQDLRKEGYCKDHHQSQALPRKGQLQLEHIWHQDLT